MPSLQHPSSPKTLAALLVLAMLVPGAAQAGKTKSSDGLKSTGEVEGTRGHASVIQRSASKGAFVVHAQLEAEGEYEVLVGGIRVAELETDAEGHGKVRFSTKRKGGNRVLGFDPRGESVEVRNQAGADVLVGTVSAPPAAEADLACCVPDDERTRCEDRTPAECIERGGTPSAAGSCFPDPCGSAPAPAVDVVCCVPDDSGPSCEDRTQPECLAAGGTIVQASSCAADPCNATPASPDEHVQCCVAAYYVWACEDRTVAECQTLGGFNKGPGQCSPNPCGDLPPSDGHGVCCLPNAKGDEIECEDRTASDCVAGGGVVKAASGVCEVDTCADVLPPNPDVMCCRPNLAGDEIECEDRTASECEAEGGVDKGPGTCGVDTCADVLPPNPDVMCCLTAPLSGEAECEDRTASQCAAEGGVDKGPGVCGVDTCADIVVVDPKVICCVPNGGDGDLRCEDRTEARCLADGGTSLGEGSCPDVDPCAVDGGNGGKN